MRGSDRQSGSLFSYVDMASRVARDHPLRLIREIVNEALAELDEAFAGLYAREGRPSIAPERRLRASLLQLFYSIRSERQLMERLDFDLLFRWFVGLGADEPVWDATVFSKNRERLLDGEITQGFLSALLARPQEQCDAPGYGTGGKRGGQAGPRNGKGAQGRMTNVPSAPASGAAVTGGRVRCFVIALAAGTLFASTTAAITVPITWAILACSIFLTGLLARSKSLLCSSPSSANSPVPIDATAAHAAIFLSRSKGLAEIGSTAKTIRGGISSATRKVQSIGVQCSRRRTCPGTHAVLVLDGGGWHVSDGLVVPVSCRYAESTRVRSSRCRAVPRPRSTARSAGSAPARSG